MVLRYTLLTAMREKVGNEYPLWCRIDCREFGIKKGITFEDGKRLACMLEEAGADAIHVSGYGGPVGGFIDAPLVYPPNNLVPYVEEIRKLVKIPVIAVGRIDPESGENILRDKKADFIAMGRPLLVDPELPNKLAAGKRDDIRPCVYCYNCVGQHLIGEPTNCAINCAVGKEKEFSLKPTKKVKNIIIVGGGPAGMEAARLSVLQGHRVILLEQNNRLGGSLLFASIVSKDNKDLLQWMIGQVRKLPVDIRLGKNADVDFITDKKPDIVIVAIGPRMVYPDIPGTELPNVFTGAQLRNLLNGKDVARKLPLWAWIIFSLISPGLRYLKPSHVSYLTRLWLPVGKNVTILGGDLAAIELAEFLVERKRNVTILSDQQDIAPEMSIPKRWRIMKDLRRNKVTLLNDVKYEEITREGVVISDYRQKKQIVKSDTVILAGSIMPDHSLYESLQKCFPEVYLIGDCADAGLLKGAIIEAARVGLTI